MLNPNPYIAWLAGGFVAGVVLMFASIAGIVLYVQKFGRYMPGPFARPDWE